MAGTLSLDALASILASGRTRGDYGDEIREFNQSEEPGWEVSLTEGRFANKDAKNVVTGLKNALVKKNEAGAFVHEGADQIVVRTVKDEGGVTHVYMINRARVEAAAAEAAA